MNNRESLLVNTISKTGYYNNGGHTLIQNIKTHSMFSSPARAGWAGGVNGVIVLDGLFNISWFYFVVWINCFFSFHECSLSLGHSKTLLIEFDINIQEPSMMGGWVSRVDWFRLITILHTSYIGFRNVFASVVYATTLAHIIFALNILTRIFHFAPVMGTYLCIQGVSTLTRQILTSCYWAYLV